MIASLSFFMMTMTNGIHRITELATAGHPVLKIRINDVYDLGGQMFLWEMATAVAAHIMGINPFDQPDVEATKKHTNRMIAEYKSNKAWPKAQPSLIAGDCEIYGDISGTTVSDALTNFLTSSTANAYVGLQVYLSPSPQIDRSAGRIAGGDFPQIRDGCNGRLRTPLSAFDRPVAQRRCRPRPVYSTDRRQTNRIWISPMLFANPTPH